MSRKVLFYIAMTLDGYIADVDGNLDWLLKYDDPTGRIKDYYDEFLQNVDTVIMGKKTYMHLITELAPDQWAYEGLHTIVATNDKETRKVHQDITFVSGDLVAHTRALLEQDGKDIWVVGGAHVAADYFKANLIDAYYIQIVPILLGDGIRLFEPTFDSIPLVFEDATPVDGITFLKYTRADIN